GSMRVQAHSANSLSVVLEAAREYGAEVRLLDLRRVILPMYVPDETPETEAVREAAAAVDWANAFVLATPDYHGSMSGAMKNFLDYFWTEFAGKLFGYVCASHEKGLTAMDQMRTAVRQCYGWSLPYGVAVKGDEDADAEGQIVRPAIVKRLQMLARDLTVYGTLISEQFNRDLASDVSESFVARYRK
nr:NAD(P)H-dependent oxidoreductase [Pyrinomonadaceae bacterium]